MSDWYVAAERENPEELERKLHEAEQLFNPGTAWEHANGGRYVVDGVCLDESTLSVLVVYHPPEHQSLRFARFTDVFSRRFKRLPTPEQG